jgi:hypothetical protein
VRQWVSNNLQDKSAMANTTQTTNVVQVSGVVTVSAGQTIDI